MGYGVKEERGVQTKRSSRLWMMAATGTPRCHVTRMYIHMLATATHVPTCNSNTRLPDCSLLVLVLSLLGVHDGNRLFFMFI